MQIWKTLIRYYKESLPRPRAKIFGLLNYMNPNWRNEFIHEIEV